MSLLLAFFIICADQYRTVKGLFTKTMTVLGTQEPYSLTAKIQLIRKIMVIPTCTKKDVVIHEAMRHPSSGRCTCIHYTREDNCYCRCL